MSEGYSKKDCKDKAKLKRIIIAELNKRERELSDGYDFYAGDVDQTLEDIANSIIASLCS